MKVLKRVPWSRNCTCHGCKSELELEANDVRVASFGSMGDYEDEFYVECPVCKTDIRLGPFYRANLPADVQLKAEGKRAAEKAAKSTRY